MLFEADTLLAGRQGPAQARRSGTMPWETARQPPGGTRNSPWEGDDLPSGKAENPSIRAGEPEYPASRAAVQRTGSEHHLHPPGQPGHALRRKREHATRLGHKVDCDITLRNSRLQAIKTDLEGFRELHGPVRHSPRRSTTTTRTSSTGRAAQHGPQGQLPVQAQRPTPIPRN